MAFLEWRKFTFFDIHKNVDSGKIAESLQDTSVTVATSGNGHVVLCDVTGWAHLISRSWEITAFKAYDMTISLAQQLPHDPYLVTIGDDEPGVNPLIKVWDWARSDRHGNPTLARTSRAVPSHMRPTPATALAVHENKNLLAVGFQDGSVSIFRGDIARQRSGKMKTLPDTGTSPITGLYFKDADKLFVVSRACVQVVQLSAARSTALDAMGAPAGCSALTDKQRLMVANDNAIYCYTSEDRGPCYALEGEKVRLNWFRTYLVITTNETPNKNAASTSVGAPRSHHITILDIQNKFIVFSKTFDEIDAVLTEWGSFYILTKNKEIIYLDEKDLQSKLSLLFKKNLYDVAIRIAGVKHYDQEGLTQIYKQYGDHLFGKGDLKGAIDQYIKTIGYLETSYVIRKYLECRHLEPLVLYVEELHKAGYATEDHTTLLLTCYVKIDQSDQHGKLKEFINSKKAIDFDVDVAIRVIRQVSVDDALSLAANHNRHDWYLQMTLDDKKDYRAALDHIVELEFEDADTYMRIYGHRLIQHLPEESTEFLKLLCTDYKPRSMPLVDEDALSGIRTVLSASPDDYIHMFVSHSEQLIAFLEHMTRSSADCSKLVFDALIEHYIHVWAKTSGEEKKQYSDKIIKVMRDPDAAYDRDHILILCQMLGFEAGVLYLYEEMKLWRSQVTVHMSHGGAEGAERALAVCRSRGAACPRLWLDVLRYRPPPQCLPELLHAIATEKLMSPILVIDCLAETSTYTLGDVRKYLMDVLKSENDVITREQELCDKYRTESLQQKEHIHRLQTEPITFQSSKCAACYKPLELPTVHFLCQHSFHKYCFESYSERECECPACETPRKNEPAHAAETLHSRLHNQHDPYAVVSEYFGRGLFNKVTLITETPGQESPPAAPLSVAAPAPPTYGPGAEAKLRQQEGQSKQVFISNAVKQVPPKGTSVVPMPEGRMRVQEASRYSSSLEANMNKLQPVHSRTTPYTSPLPTRRADPPPPKNISAAIANNDKNPFDDANYDEAKNPFADESDTTNPFGDDDDYDKNLNPFSGFAEHL